MAYLLSNYERRKKHGEATLCVRERERESFFFDFALAAELSSTNRERERGGRGRLRGAGDAVLVTKILAYIQIL